MDPELEKEKVSFEQNCESIRSLNQIMWQIPLIAMTLTGGLWYGVVSTTSLPIVGVYALLGLAGLGNLILIPVLFRVRHVMRAYMDKASMFYPDHYPDAELKRGPEFFRTKIVVKLFAVLLTVSSIMSFAGMFVLNPIDKEMTQQAGFDCTDKSHYHSIDD